MTDSDRRLMEQALARDRRAVRQLIDELSPIVQARVARRLLRRGLAQSRDLREEVKDLTQHVFVVLFAGDGRVLRQWSPERGLSLANFVGLVAEREVSTVLRSRRKSPWREEDALPDDFDRGEGTEGEPEQLTASREILRAVLAAVRAQLSDDGVALFEWLIVDERPIDDVCALTGKSPDAVYAWRSRLGRLVVKVAGEIMRDAAAQPQAQERDHEERRGLARGARTDGA
ncbi:RNA polymerase sigma factor [Sorangium sp. So ce341]|uniref:RNA polymerase sigma factor n=1 Tax=Sorangium sp. So ce341 TaxID=3133302 RepID=UPI003F630DA8